MDEGIGYILFLIVLVIVLMGGAYVADASSCQNRAKMMGFEHSYGVMQGCMIKTPTGWIPLDAYRVIN